MKQKANYYAFPWMTFRDNGCLIVVIRISSRRKQDWGLACITKEQPINGPSATGDDTELEIEVGRHGPSDLGCELESPTSGYPFAHTGSSHSTAASSPSTIVVLFSDPNTIYISYRLYINDFLSSTKNEAIILTVIPQQGLYWSCAFCWQSQRALSLHGMAYLNQSKLWPMRNQSRSIASCPAIRLCLLQMHAIRLLISGIKISSRPGLRCGERFYVLEDDPKLDLFCFNAKFLPATCKTTTSCLGSWKSLSAVLNRNELNTVRDHRRLNEDDVNLHFSMKRIQ